MAIVKCMNPECDYFERAVPEGDCCPYCGEPLNINTPDFQPTPQYYSPPEPQPINAPLTPPRKAPIATVIEPTNVSLKLIHSNGQTFTIDRYRAVDKIYLGRLDGFESDRPTVDLSGIPFAERISRHHAYVVWDEKFNSFTISDDRSTNGTILNGQSLNPRQPYTLHIGDRLEFGREQKVVFTIEIN